MKEKSGLTTSPRFRSHHPPNYMKSTASADARREQSKVSKTIPQTSMKTQAHKRKKGSTNSPNSSKNANVHVERATCSSTLKDRRFPDCLKQHPESKGTSDVKVCRYRYCSFNGRLHPLSPPLKSFLSERRRALKAKGNADGESLRNQTGSKFPQSGGDATASYNAMDGESPDIKDKYEDATTEIRNTRQASSAIEEMATSVRSNEYRTTKHDDQVHNRTEDSTEGERNAVRGLNYKNTKTPDSDDKRLTAKSNESPNRKSDDPGSFNPRGPHLLHIEPEPGAEEVNLRHQELEERKKPEEWMVDYALRREVRIGGSRRQVASLVQAFERVVPKTKL